MFYIVYFSLELGRKLTTNYKYLKGIQKHQQFVPPSVRMRFIGNGISALSLSMKVIRLTAVLQLKTPNTRYLEQLSTAYIDKPLE